MRKRSLLFIVFALIFSVPAFSQVHTPEKGSVERKAILDALRIPIERELKQPIVFAANNFNVLDNWAFIGGEPQLPGGGKPDYRRTPYQRAVAADMFDNNFFAILKRTAGRWRVVTYRIGCTDVCYSDWWRRYRAPKAIFPYNE
jgi:hypothetical protein